MKKGLSSLQKIIATAILTILIVLAIMLLVSKRNTTNDYTVVSSEPPICTQDLAQSCGDATVTVEDSSGSTKDFRYSADKLPKVDSGTNVYTVLKKGNKVQLVTSGNKIVEAKVIN